MEQSVILIPFIDGSDTSEVLESKPYKIELHDRYMEYWQFNRTVDEDRESDSKTYGARREYYVDIRALIPKSKINYFQIFHAVMNPGKYCLVINTEDNNYSIYFDHKKEAVMLYEQIKDWWLK